MPGTTIKERMLKAVEELPVNAGIEEAIERLYLLYKVEKGIKEADDGKLISHPEAKGRMKKWLDG